MFVQSAADQTTMEGLAKTVTQEEILEYLGLSFKMRIITKEEVDFSETERYINKPALEVQPNGYESECAMRVQPNECDGSDEFGIGTPRRDADVTNPFGDSPVHYIEENYIKCEDIDKRQWTGSSCDGEYYGRDVKKNIVLFERAAVLKKLNQSRSHKNNLSVGRKDKLPIDLHESSFVTKKADLKKHTLLRKSKSEVDSFKCEKCPFVTKYSGNLKLHMLTHKSKGQVGLYKCRECSHATKHARSLKTHMLVHKAKSEVVLYECCECSFATKYAGSIKQHILVHKPKSEVRLRKCEECPFTTKHVNSLKRHSLVHKAKAKVALYKCNECSYAAKHAGNLKQHVLVHRGESEVDLHKCRECSFVTRHARSLTTHALVHRSESEVDLFECRECSFATKHARSLRRHLSVHQTKASKGCAIRKK